MINQGPAPTTPAPKKKWEERSDITRMQMKNPYVSRQQEDDKSEISRLPVQAPLTPMVKPKFKPREADKVKSDHTYVPPPEETQRKMERSNSDVSSIPNSPFLKLKPPQQSNQDLLQQQQYKFDFNLDSKQKMNEEMKKSLEFMRSLANQKAEDDSSQNKSNHLFQVKHQTLQN
jgi:hypothetical protein